MIFQNKAVSKDIKRRTWIWNNFLKDRSKENKKKYSKKKSNFCVLLLRKHKLDCFANVEGTVMQIKKALMNDCLCISKVPWNFRISTIYNFALI